MLDDYNELFFFPAPPLYSSKSHSKLAFNYDADTIMHPPRKRPVRTAELNSGCRVPLYNL